MELARKRCYPWLVVNYLCPLGAENGVRTAVSRAKTLTGRFHEKGSARFRVPGKRKRSRLKGKVSERKHDLVYERTLDAICGGGI